MSDNINEVENNALINTEIINYNFNDDDYDYFSKTFYDNTFQDKEGNDITWISNGSKETRDKYLNEIIKDTTIKRGCCLNKKQISVRVPLTPDRLKELDEFPEKFGPPSTTKLMKKFNYEERLVAIDKNVCKQNGTHDSDGNVNHSLCENFYRTYCKNTLKNFFNQTGTNFNTYNHDDYAFYSPDCACFGDVRGVNKAVNGIPNKCIFSGCDPNKAYQDKLSRENSCDLTICNNLIDLSDSKVGGNINIKQNIEQVCGSDGQISEQESDNVNDKARTSSSASSSGSGTDSNEDDEEKEGEENESGITSFLTQYGYYVGGGAVVFCCCSILCIIVIVVMTTMNK